MYDVAIIGCGITGAAAAYELSAYDLSIVIIEKENDVATGASKANSAIVHAGYDPQTGTLKARLNVEGNALYEPLCERLGVPFTRCGSLMLAFSPQEVSQLDEIMSLGIANGVPGLEIISPEKLWEMEPNASRKALAALYAPSAGITNPWELVIALTEHAVINGADLKLNSEIISIEKIDSEPIAVEKIGGDGDPRAGFRLRSRAEEIEARYILNAAGVHSDAIHNMIAPETFKIIPDRGVYYLLDNTEDGLVRHVIFQCPTPVGKGALVAPTTGGNVIVGPNNEKPACREDTAVSREGLSEIADKARRLVPSVNLRASIRNFAGVRPASDRDDFIIEASADVPGFIDLAGIKSPGLTSAPAIAKLAVKLLAEAGLEITEKSRVNHVPRRVRFAALSDNEKKELVRLNADYGHVICRCRAVTEGEILDALRSPVPPVSVDGVKRRTEAGLGRCQGGFCGPRALEILAREAGVSPVEIPQDKNGSLILTGETKGNGHSGETKGGGHSDR